ncbi:PKD domain-containing protein, partial [Flavobacterium sp.]|uniref:PKD domain-containing protein n=1 Tax=Flavobacterium sp. TaxID=239 RepID=UPI0038FCC068
MKFFFKFLFLLLPIIPAFSQNETNNWYFGENAGLSFNSGSPVALTDGQLNTFEGCATISDTSGQLLLYTDGITVYNKNHLVMVNGTGLLGDHDASQSATIVQKPGSTTLYYIFTVDAEARSNGFRYSIVDMSLDGGLGAVTSSKNILIFAPSCEKIGIVKHANGTDFWIVSHGWGNDAFYVYLLSNSGLNNTPITSNIGFTPQPTANGDGFQSEGYLRISPNGSKMVNCNYYNGITQLFDFNNVTGLVSNQQSIIIGTDFFYGAEFSQNSEVLYLSAAGGRNIYQFDLNTTNVSSTATLIYSSIKVPGALQLGPDAKIYVAFWNQNKIGVINNPNVLGLACNLQSDAVDLAGKLCQIGLPPFVTSFFYTPTIQLNNTCEGEATSLNYTTNRVITNTIWNFGDGSPISNSPTANHIYNTAGTYTVTLTLTSAFGTVTNTRDIIIYPKPVINPIVSLKQCDDDTDGFSVFNLTEANAKISTNFANEIFSYFETANDAQNNINPIPNFTTYTNQIVSNDVIYVRVSVNGCFRVAQLNLIVSTTQVPVTFTRTFTQCDDALSGTNTDGVATFNFANVDTEVRNLFPVNQSLTITYYRNLADALAESNAITNISNYRNIGYANSQNIYPRVDSDLNNDCLLLKSFITLNVERIP